MNDLSVKLPPPLPLDITAPADWRRVELHVSSVLLFWGTVYGLCGVALLYSGGYAAFAKASLLDRLLMVGPFLLGPFVAGGLDWLRLKGLGWLTRKLGDMA
jgi:hypothetical protein